jgi:transcription initiation factor TFIIF subunit alpha
MDEAFFLKKKTRPNAIRGRGGHARPITSGSRPPATVARPPARPKPKLPNRKVGLQAEPPRLPATNGDNILTFDIVSAAPGQKLRYNVMKLNSSKDVDPGALPAPILMNRKQPGPKNLPQLATDAEGKVIGRYVFDEEGNPVLDEEGKPTIEKKVEMDMSLVGTAPGTNNKRRGKRQTKEVFHQDIEVIKLRREEANPWVLESKHKTPESAETAAHIPEHWVGRMVEQAALPTVLLINNGTEANFTMIPLGRTYKFEPERPFKVMDADQAHKYVR